MFNQIPHNVKVKLLTNFTGSIVYRAVFPFVALYLNDLVGSVLTGSLISLTVISSYFMRLVGGYLADIHSRKKIVLIGNSLNFISMAIMTLSILKFNNMPYIFVLGYIIHISFVPISGPSMQALIIDCTPPKMRKDVYTITYWSMNVAASFGYFFGGMMYESHKGLLFSLLTITSLFTVISYYIFLEDSNKNKKQTTKSNIIKNMLNHYSVAIKDYSFLLTVIGMGLLLVGEEMMPGYVAIRLKDLFSSFKFMGVNITGVKMLSIIMLENTIFVIFLTLIANKITDKWSRKNVMIVSLMLYCIGFIGLSYSLGFSSLLLFGLINSIGETVAIPLVGAEQTQLMPKEHLASYIALSSLSHREAAFIGGFLISIKHIFKAPIMTFIISLIIILGVVSILRGIYGNKSIPKIKNYS